MEQPRGSKGRHSHWGASCCLRLVGVRHPCRLGVSLQPSLSHWTCATEPSPPDDESVLVEDCTRQGSARQEEQLGRPPAGRWPTPSLDSSPTCRSGGVGKALVGDLEERCVRTLVARDRKIAELPSVNILESMPQHRPVDLFKAGSRADLDHVIRADPEDVRVERSVVNLAHRYPLRTAATPASSRSGTMWAASRQLAVAEGAHCTSCAVSPHDGGTEDRLVQPPAGLNHYVSLDRVLKRTAQTQLTMSYGVYYELQLVGFFANDEDRKCR